MNSVKFIAPEDDWQAGERGREQLYLSSSSFPFHGNSVEQSPCAAEMNHRMAELIYDATAYNILSVVC